MDVTLRARTAAGLLTTWIALLTCGCTSPAQEPGTAPAGQGGAAAEGPEERWPGRPRIESRPLAIALFPIQLVPDVLANAVVALYPGNLWPLQYLLYPISVPYWGITDAWEGRPFWDPSALHE